MRRFNTMHRGVVAALEQEEIIAAANAPEAVVVDDPEKVDVDIVEANDIGADVDALTEETNESVEIAEALESIADDLKISMANGGLDRHAAQAIGRTVQYMGGRLGIKKSPMPSMEAFGGVSNRIEGTRISIEAISEMAKKAWDGIIAAIKRIIEWGVEFYKKVTSSHEKSHKRAAELKSKFEALTSEDKKETEIDNERLFKTLCIGGKFDVAKLKTSVLAAAKINLSTYTELEITEGTIEWLDSSKNEEEFLSKVKIIKLHDNLDVVNNPESDGFAAPKEGLKLYRGNELPGNKALIARSPEGDLTGADAIKAVGGTNGYGYSVVEFNPKLEIKPEKFPVLSKADAIAICDAVTAISTAGIAFKAFSDKINEAKKNLESALDKISKSDKDIKSARPFVTAIVFNIDKPAAPMSTHLLQLSTSLLDYISLSLKQYGKKEEPKKEEAKSGEKPAEAKPEEKKE